MEATKHPTPTSHRHVGPTPPEDTADRQYAPVEDGTEGRCSCGTWVKAFRYLGTDHVRWFPWTETPFDPSTEV